jgi:hypothetical protein
MHVESSVVFELNWLGFLHRASFMTAFSYVFSSLTCLYCPGINQLSSHFPIELLSWRKIDFGSHIRSVLHSSSNLMHKFGKCLLKSEVVKLVACDQICSVLDFFFSFPVSKCRNSVFST